MVSPCLIYRIVFKLLKNPIYTLSHTMSDAKYLNLL